MNIALFTDTYVPEVNGVATSVFTLYKTLCEHGENVYVITSNPFNKKLIIDGHIIRMPGIKLKFLYNYVLTSMYSNRVFKILKKAKIDVIHVHADLLVSEFGRIVAKKLNIPLVYTYHTMYEDYSAYATKGKVDRFAKFAVREYTKDVCDNSNGIIAPSQKTKDYLRRTGVSKYISIVPTGLDLQRFLPLEDFPQKREELFKKLEIAENSKVFLSLGRLGDEKSVDVIIENFNRFVNEHNMKNLHLLVVGDGTIKKKLMKMCEDAKTQPFVHFIGKVDPIETPFYYFCADLFISASLTETQGLTYIEAMACHRPVLSRYDFNLSSLINDGLNGYFFGTYEDFDKKVTEFLSLDSTYLVEMQERAYQSVDKYSLENFYKNVMEVYLGVVRKHF